MMACFYPIKYDNIGSRRCREKFRFKDTIKATYSINKFIIDNVIRNILMDECTMSVIGYDKYSNKYWCKKYSDKTCELSLELELSYNNDLNTLEVQFVPLIGHDSDIRNFIFKFNECMMLFDSSIFCLSF